jgi:hypothetical protein
LLDDMGCQAGVIAANLTTVMTEDRAKTTKSFQSIKLGIYACRDEPVQDWRAHDLVILAVDCRAITASQVPEVLQEWREPNHATALNRLRLLAGRYRHPVVSQNTNGAQAALL